MSQGEQSTREAFHSTETVVRDPEVVLTKCSVKRQKNTQGQKRKCSRCGGRGHNVRKCKQKCGTEQRFNDSTAQTVDLGCDNNVQPRNGVCGSSTSPILQQPTDSRNVVTIQQSSQHNLPFMPDVPAWQNQRPPTWDSDSINQA